MRNTKTLPTLFFLFAAFVFVITQAESESESIVTEQPQALKSFKVSNTQIANGCTYSVSIKTSCSSTTFTRDQISLSFGDAYGNQVYAPRLDDPSSRTFERCSTDTFKISGPCMYRICYVYLYRVGSDGWKPESVKITSPSYPPVAYSYNTFVPYGVWFGFNFCNNNNGDSMVSAASAAAI